MKKKLFFLIFFSVLLFATPVLAGPDITSMTKDVASSSGFDANTNDITLSQNIGTLIKGALTLVGTVFLALTVYAGFLWMTARGEDDQVEKAMHIVKRSIFGLIIVVAAYSITAFVMGNVLDASTNINTVGGSSAPAQKSTGSKSKDFWSGLGKGVDDQAGKLGGN